MKFKDWLEAKDYDGEGWEMLPKKEISFIRKLMVMIAVVALIVYLIL